MPGGRRTMRIASTTMKSLDRILAVLSVISMAMIVVALALGGTAKGTTHLHQAPVGSASHHVPSHPTVHPMHVPFALNITAVAAGAACLAVLAGWGWWQKRHRCVTCGYCPVWCRCDELAESRNR